MIDSIKLITRRNNEYSNRISFISIDDAANLNLDQLDSAFMHPQLLNDK